MLCAHVMYSCCRFVFSIFKLEWAQKYSFTGAQFFRLNIIGENSAKWLWYIRVKDVGCVKLYFLDQ